MFFHDSLVDKVYIVLLITYVLNLLEFTKNTKIQHIFIWQKEASGIQQKCFDTESCLLRTPSWSEAVL